MSIGDSISTSYDGVGIWSQQVLFNREYVCLAQHLNLILKFPTENQRNFLDERINLDLTYEMYERLFTVLRSRWKFIVARLSSCMSM